MARSSAASRSSRTLADATARPIVPTRQVEHPQRSDGRWWAEPDTEPRIVGERRVPHQVERVTRDLVVRGVPSACGLHDSTDQTCGDDRAALEQLEGASR